MIRFSLLGSGSSGNAVLVATESHKILIDNGLSLRQLVLRAAELGESLDGLHAVFVTHEHGDHVSGLGVLSRRLSVPVFLTEGTLANLPRAVGRLNGVELFEAGEHFEFGELTVGSFSVSHDAADPVGYVVQCDGAKLGFAHDLGHASHLVRNRLAGSHALVLESNYCPHMLQKGRYPPAVQQRIRGRRGHLSNRDMGSLLAALRHDALRLVVLVHISEENNDPELASDIARHVLRGSPAEVVVAHQNTPTPMFEVAP